METSENVRRCPHCGAEATPGRCPGCGRDVRPSDDDRTMTADERADEASMDSYPASDPPAW